MKNLGYFFKEGARSMFSHGFMSFAAIGVTVASLLIMGTFSLVAYNANVNLTDLQKENAMVAFVDDSLTEAQAKALQSQLEKVDNVADCTFVSRQEARDTYVTEYDEDDMFKDLPSEVLRHRYVLHLTDPDQIAATNAAVDAIEGIDEVRADEVISAGFITIRNVAGAISLVLIAVLLMVSLFIISNTIRLTVFARRKEIAIMKYVGATDWFIRWPFVMEGMVLGLFGSIIAAMVLRTAYTAMAEKVYDTLAFFPLIPEQPFLTYITIVVVISGMVVGAIGSAVSIKKFLKV